MASHTGRLELWYRSSYRAIYQWAKAPGSHSAKSNPARGLLRLLGGNAGDASCVCGTLLAAAQSQYSVAPVTVNQAAQNQSALGQAAPATATKQPDVSKEALVFDPLQTRIRMEADGTGTRETVARIRILAEFAARYAIGAFYHSS